MATGAGADFISVGRPPSLLDAILPVVVLILKPGSAATSASLR